MNTNDAPALDYKHRATPAEWIDTADVAKLIRKALRHDFPGIKFFVRSSRYSGGSSIRIEYTDGPASADVDALANSYAGARFDGMIDMQYHVRHVLFTDADGIERPLVVANDGTGGQRGSHPAHYVHPEDVPAGARPVNISASYVTASRGYTPQAFRAAAGFVLASNWCDNYTGRAESREDYAPEYDAGGRLTNPPRRDGGYNRDANEVARQVLDRLDLTGCSTADEYAARVWLTLPEDNSLPSGAAWGSADRARFTGYQAARTSLMESAGRDEWNGYSSAPPHDYTDADEARAVKDAQDAAAAEFWSAWNGYADRATAHGVKLNAMGERDEIRAAALASVREIAETKAREYAVKGRESAEYARIDAAKAARRDAADLDGAGLLSLRDIDGDAVRQRALWIRKPQNLADVQEQTDAKALEAVATLDPDALSLCAVAVDRWAHLTAEAYDVLTADLMHGAPAWLAARGGTGSDYEAPATNPARPDPSAPFCFYENHTPAERAAYLAASYSVATLVTAEGRAPFLADPQGYEYPRYVATADANLPALALDHSTPADAQPEAPNTAPTGATVYELGADALAAAWLAL